MFIADIAAPVRRPRPALGVAGALGLVALALLTACSSSSGGSPAGAAAAPTGAASGAGGNFAARQGGPAASGLIAAASGSTLQVQNQQDGQVAVTWSASTTFTQQVAVAAGSIAAGDCVTAVSTSGDPGSTSFTATTIRVTKPRNGSCDAGFGGGFGGGGRPSGMPTGGGPSRAPGGAAPSGAPTRTGTIASGVVVSVSGSELVVAARQFDRSGAAASAAPSASGTPTTVDDTVTIAASTTITGEQAATSAAATVGRCVTAQGRADSTGTVAATSIALTDAVDGACTGGFGGFGRPGSGTASGSTHG